MRKILVSVLSVAGLLAVVLALASSPASAAKDVIQVDTDADFTAGVYTLSWETAGGCDPGSGTSGASGSLVLTVTSTDQPSNPPVTGELFSDEVETDFVTIDDRCTYEWSASFTDAATKANCGVGLDETENAEGDPVIPEHHRSGYHRG